MIWIYIIVTIAAIDLGIKAYVEKYRKEDKNDEIFGGKVILKKHHNFGAIFNIGTAKNSVVMMISAILTVLALLVFIVTLTKKGKVLAKISLSFLLGGAFSNTYDRLRRNYVVDYFSLKHPFFEKHNMKNIENIIFNIGDFAILIGSVGIVLNGLLNEIKKDFKKPLKESKKKLKKDFSKTKKDLYKSKTEIQNAMKQMKTSTLISK